MIGTTTGLDVVMDYGKVVMQRACKINLIENIPSKNYKIDGMKNIKCKVTLCVILGKTTLIYLSRLSQKMLSSFCTLQFLIKWKLSNDKGILILLSF